MKRRVNLQCRKCDHILRDRLIGKRIPRCGKNSLLVPGGVCLGRNEILWDDGGPSFTMLGMGYAKKRV